MEYPPRERIIDLFRSEAEKGEQNGEHSPVRNRMENVPQSGIEKEHSPVRD
jgi:hypothetical protein